LASIFAPIEREDRATGSVKRCGIASARAKDGGPTALLRTGFSAAQRTMKLSAAPVETTFFR
jgi:hypothetical protein